MQPKPTKWRLCRKMPAAELDNPPPVWDYGDDGFVAGFWSAIKIVRRCWAGGTPRIIKCSVRHCGILIASGVKPV